MRELSDAEVQKRVESYEDAQVTQCLYEFGQMMVAANRERTKQLESKATAITGYGLAVLALLASREPVQSVVARWPPNLIVAASICAAAALVCTAVALYVRSHAWFSDNQWFENENDVLDDADSLRRCHVLAMHFVNSELKSSNDWKANSLIVAQWFLLAAAFFLVAWLVWR